MWFTYLLPKNASVWLVVLLYHIQVVCCVFDGCGVGDGVSGYGGCGVIDGGEVEIVVGKLEVLCFLLVVLVYHLPFAGGSSCGDFGGDNSGSGGSLL